MRARGGRPTVTDPGGSSSIPNLGTNHPNLGMIRLMPTPKPSTSRQAAKAPIRRASLADALFGLTQQRVLALLFGHPDRSFYANEIIAQTRGGSGAVQRELTRLASSGLVTVRAHGNQKHYQADPASPIFGELCALVRKTMGLADPLREALAPLAGRTQAAFIYGSVAKREDSAGSDIDLMLISDELAYADVYDALEGASQRIGRTVNPTIYTSAELARRRARGGAFVKRVLEQPKIWIVGDEDSLGV